MQVFLPSHPPLILESPRHANEGGVRAGRVEDFQFMSHGNCAQNKFLFGKTSARKFLENHARCILLVVRLSILVGLFNGIVICMSFPQQ